MSDRGQMFEAEAKIVVLRPRGLNIIDIRHSGVIYDTHLYLSASSIGILHVVC